jgi:hypothetical protein
MLRKGLVALMMGVICAGSAVGDEPAQRQTGKAPAGVTGWFRGKASALRSGSSESQEAAGARNRTANAGKATLNNGPSNGGIQRAVVADAEQQSFAIRQISGQTQNDGLPGLVLPPVETEASPAATPLQPVPAAPIEMQPLLPNSSTVSGPQYFSAVSGDNSTPRPVHPGNNWQSYQAPAPVQMASQGRYWNASNYSATGQVYQSTAPMNAQTGGMYPQTGAALYPCPIPGIPHQMGGTAIMNQAFHPHEMLYAHSYSAMYPPYYYKVNGGWMVTPFGVWSKEDWKLQGTRVDVQYKSHISPFSGFHPPGIR